MTCQRIGFVGSHIQTRYTNQIPMALNGLVRVGLVYDWIGLKGWIGFCEWVHGFDSYP